MTAPCSGMPEATTREQLDGLQHRSAAERRVAQEGVVKPGGL